MSMIKHCDKCNRVIIGEDDKLSSPLTIHNRCYDLCRDCSELFMNWLKTKPIIEERIVVTSENQKKKPVKDIELCEGIINEFLLKMYPVDVGKKVYKGNSTITVDLNKSKRTLYYHGLVRSGFKTIKQIIDYKPKASNDPKLYRISTKTFLEIRDFLRKEYPDLCESGTSN